MLSGYKLNIDYRAGKKNLALASSCQPDYAKALDNPAGAPEGLCIPTTLTAQCNTTCCLRQLYATGIPKNLIFNDVPPVSLLNFICEGLAEDYTAKEARTALGLPSGFLAKEYSILAMPHCQY